MKAGGGRPTDATGWDLDEISAFVLLSSGWNSRPKSGDQAARNTSHVATCNVGSDEVHGQRIDCAAYRTIIIVRHSDL
jgi:hypothetical protein